MIFKKSIIRKMAINHDSQSLLRYLHISAVKWRLDGVSSTHPAGENESINLMFEL